MMIIAAFMNLNCSYHILKYKADKNLSRKNTLARGLELKEISMQQLGLIASNSILDSTTTYFYYVGKF